MMIIILNPFNFYLLTWISATKIITSYQNAKKIENPCSKYVHTLKIMIICVARKLINFPVRDKFATKIEFEIIFRLLRCAHSLVHRHRLATSMCYHRPITCSVILYHTNTATEKTWIVWNQMNLNIQPDQVLYFLSWWMKVLLHMLLSIFSGACLSLVWNIILIMNWGCITIWCQD